MKTLLHRCLAPFFGAAFFALSLLPAAAADAAKWDGVTKRMQAFVNNSTIAGSVTLVATRDQVVNVQAVGFADLAAKTPMRADHLFWIASMTKPITGACVLMLQDEGKLSVDDAVEKHLPEFKGQWLVTAKGSDQLTLGRPARPITLRDLLTHTSGMGNFAAPRMDCSLAELVTGVSQVPLQFPPGSQWSYNNPGINTLGRVVEVVSGQRFEDFLQQRVLDPLAMKDTTFWPTVAQAKRIAKAYKPGKEGKGLEEVSNAFLQGALSDRRRTPHPAGGLFSTAADVAVFYQMMLSGGEWRGKRLLSKSSVEQLTRTQTGDIKTGFTDGMSWGFGFQVVKDPQGVTAMLSPGTFGHGGAYATQSWADPKKGLVLVMMIQRTGFSNGDKSVVRQSFQEGAVAAFSE